MPSREVIKIKLSRFILRIFRSVRGMRTGLISQVTQLPANTRLFDLRRVTALAHSNRHVGVYAIFQLMKKQAMELAATDDSLRARVSAQVTGLTAFSNRHMY